MLLSEVVLLAAVAVIALALVGYALSLWRPKPSFWLVARIGTWLAFAVLFVFLWVKYIEVDYPPFQTLYESLVFLVLTTILIYALFEIFYRIAALGLLTHLFALGMLFYAYLEKDQIAGRLPAALQSGWFVPHVVVYFLGYAALFLAAALAVIYLLRPERRVSLATSKGERVFSFYKLMHLVVILGYIFITVGMVIGALWAKEAWGDYWAWDPKENWSLVTFLIYTMYFHIKRNILWSKRKKAAIVVAGFAAVMFTYLGMSFLPTAQQSEHVYIEKELKGE